MRFDVSGLLSTLTLSIVIAAGTLAVPALAPVAWAQSADGVPVTASKPTHQDVPIFLQGVGVVTAHQTVVLHPRVDGTLDQVLFAEGDDVKAGTMLAVIDPRPYQATLELAIAKKAADEASLVNARLNLGRSSQLARNQFETQVTVDTNTSQVAQLIAQIKGDEATISSARLNLDFTQIRAPFDGRVGLRMIDPGNFIRAQDNASVGIVTLSEIRPISATFTLPQDQLPQVTAAMAKGKPPVIALTSDGKTELSKGDLLTIDNSIDTTNGTIKVKATFANTDSKLWPGQFINARLLVGTRTAALTVASSCVQRGPDGLFVYVIGANQTVKATPVTVLQDTGRVAVIGSGLADDAIVVQTGQSRLYNGVKVTVSPAAAS